MTKHCSNRCFIAFIIVLTGTYLSASYADSGENHRPRSIQVSGTGKVMVAPDKAELTLSIEVHAKTAEAAKSQAATAMEAMLNVIKKEGVPDKDIQTSTILLNPDYSSTIANKITGYQLTNQLTVTIHSIDKTGNIIDAAVKAGGDAARVQGINFGIDNPETAISAARSKAYANAKNKAEQYAKLAGVGLGAPLHITEGSVMAPNPVHYAEVRALKAAMVDSAPTPVQAGEQEVNVNVEVIFGIN